MQALFNDGEFKGRIIRAMETQEDDSLLLLAEVHPRFDEANQPVTVTAEDLDGGRSRQVDAS